MDAAIPLLRYRIKRNKNMSIAMGVHSCPVHDSPKRKVHDSPKRKVRDSSKRKVSDSPNRKVRDIPNRKSIIAQIEKFMIAQTEKSTISQRKNSISCSVGGQRTVYSDSGIVIDNREKSILLNLLTSAT